MKRLLTASDRAAGERLDAYLAVALGHTRSQIQRWLKANAVTVNGRLERSSYRLQAGDRLEVSLPADADPIPAPTAPILPIVYQDADLLVVDKPAGLSAHPGNGHTTEATVADFARQYTTDPDPERPGLVHRLDRDTSGLLVIARTAAAKTALQQQWRHRAVHKTYQLLVVGRPEPAEAVIDLPLGPDPAHPLQRRVIPQGKPARTRYRTLAAYPGYTLLEAYPETGRTHQLRVHFAALGHPIAGDTLYGPPRRPLGLQRQFLHAVGLQFTGPSGQGVQLTSPLPSDLQAILTSLSGRL